MKNLFALILVISSHAAFSQGAKIIHKATIEKLPPAEKFTFIEPITDTTQFKYVATFQGKDRIRSANIETLYYVIREKANKLGANCYKLSSYYTDSLNAEVILILVAYYASDSLITLNRSNHEKNVVYFFGNEKPDDKSISFTVNGEEKEIPGGTFYKISVKEDDRILINKGGKTGTSMLLKYEADQLPAFYSLSGFGLTAFTPLPTPQPSHGITFKTGGINRIGNISLGLLMIKLLNQSN